MHLSFDCLFVLTHRQQHGSSTSKFNSIHEALGCIGIPQAAQNAISNQGFINVALLGLIRFWVVNYQRLGLPVDADDFTAITAFEQLQLMVRLQEDEAVADKESVAKLPDKFRQPSQWRVFAEMIETYLSQLKGSGRIALNYVIRKNTVPVPG